MGSNVPDNPDGCHVAFRGQDVLQLRLPPEVVQSAVVAGLCPGSGDHTFSGEQFSAVMAHLFLYWQRHLGEQKQIENRERQAGANHRPEGLR